MCRRQNLAKKRFHCPLKFYLSFPSLPLPPPPLLLLVFFNFSFLRFPQAQVLSTELPLFGYDLKVNFSPGVSTPLYDLYGDVPLDKVWFLSFLS